MFCQDCGHEVGDDRGLCEHCGSGEPLLVVRPSFVSSVQILSYLPFCLFLGFWGAGFFGGFSLAFMDLVSLGIPNWAPFLFFAVVFAVLIPVVLYRMHRGTYDRTVYSFFPDRLEYHEGFFAVEEKTIPLSRITEVSLRKGILQHKHGLGTIVLSTPATSYGKGAARAGIHVADIAEPDEVYRRVRALVERNLPAAPHRRAA